MPMLLRALLLVCLCGAAAAQNRPEPFEHLFGAPGAPGSFRAKFIREGAGLFVLQASDHHVSLDAAKKATHGPDDWLLLAFNGGAADGLRLSSATPLAVNPATEPWTVTTADGSVTFTLDLKNGLVLEKVLRHDPKQRGFTLELGLRNTSPGATGTLDLTLSGLTLVAPHESSLFGNLTGALAVAADGTTQHLVPSAGVMQPLVIDGKNLLFAGTTNRFFGAFLWPKDDIAKQALATAEVDTLPPRDDVDTNTKANTTLRVRYGLRLPIPAQGAETRATFGLYVGPKSFRVFDTLPEPLRFAAAVDTDLASPCCGIEVPGGRTMAKVLLWLLGIFHDFVGGWGVAIMMLTILVRGALAPLNFHMQKSMRAYGARMAVLKPKMEAMKAKFGDDQRGYQQAMVAFQREHKLLPPLGGCLPVVLTMPIYIGLFTALRTAYDVRQQPFLWIEDLSRPDALFALPFWPDQFNLLPLVWIGMFLFLQLRTPLPADPQQRQMMSIMRYMPIVFGVMLYNYAGALLVYMVTSMLWSMVESSIIKRILGPLDPNVAAMTPTTI